MSWLSKTWNSFRKRAGTVLPAVGAAVGSIIPGAGTAVGGAIGGALGAIIQKRPGGGDAVPEISTAMPTVQQLPQISQLPPIIANNGGFTGMGFGGSYENKVNGENYTTGVAQHRSNGNSSAMLIALGLGGLVLLSK